MIAVDDADDVEKLPAAKATSDDSIKEAEKVMMQNIERFVQRIRMVS